MTDTPEPRVERLSRELAAAFWNRADLYRLILEALIAELGPRRAETVLAGAIDSTCARSTPVKVDMKSPASRSVADSPTNTGLG